MGLGIAGPVTSPESSNNGESQQPAIGLLRGVESGMGKKSLGIFGAAHATIVESRQKNATRQKRSSGMASPASRGSPEPSPNHKPSQPIDRTPVVRARRPAVLNVPLDKRVPLSQDSLQDKKPAVYPGRNESGWLFNLITGHTRTRAILLVGAAGAVAKLLSGSDQASPPNQALYASVEIIEMRNQVGGAHKPGVVIIEAEAVVPVAVVT